jgi:hypothetical protein
MPSSVEFLMRCYYSPSIHPEYDSKSMQNAAEELRKLGLLKEHCKETLTKRGEAYCEALMRVALPEAAWVVGDNIIVRGETNVG